MTSIGRFLLSLYLWTVVGAVTVVVSSLILLSFPFALFDRARRLAHGLGTVWARSLLKLNPLWDLRIDGREYLQRGRGYVIVSNHASLADIVCLFTIGHQFKWLAKKSLFYVPFLGWAMSVMGYVPLERGRHGSIRKSYRETLDWLRRDMSVLIFPEGTRSRTGEMGRFKSGAFRLAIESGRPVLPIVLAGTWGVLSKGKAGFGKPGAAYLVILPPVETTGWDLKDEEKLREKVESLMRREWVRRNQMLGRAVPRHPEGGQRPTEGSQGSLAPNPC